MSCRGFLLITAQRGLLYAPGSIDPYLAGQFLYGLFVPGFIPNKLLSSFGERYNISDYGKLTFNPVAMQALSIKGMIIG